MSRYRLLARGLCCAAAGCFLLVLSGCGGGSTPAPASSTGTETAATPATSTGAPDSPTGDPKPRTFAPVALDEGSGTASGGVPAGPTLSPEQQMASIVQALQPLQIMLGKWRGTTNKKFSGGFSSVEELEWVWDFKTDRNRPALVMKSDNGPYMREARLTFLPETQEFQLTAKPPEGEPRVLKGTWQEEPQEVPTDANDKPQHTHKLVLTQLASAGDDELWQMTFNQREDNRYLAEWSRKRGSGEFMRVDTVGAQRLGTSFAKSEEDYGEQKCIISGGLGVMTVTYKDKSYPVCCSGCAAAFNDDPELWLAKLAAKAEMKKE